MARRARRKFASRLLFALALVSCGSAALVFDAPALLAGSRLGPPLPAMGPSFRRTVNLATAEPPGTILIDKDARALFFILPGGKALRYDISVGREGFSWSGKVRIGAKQEWPEWRPPAEMRAREPGLPEFVPAGPYNPLGARALYLFDSGRDTLYRIHGTNNPDGVGFDGTSGCFRLTNTDIIDLYGRVAVGARVVVE